MFVGRLSVLKINGQIGNFRLNMTEFLTKNFCVEFFQKTNNYSFIDCELT